MIKQNPFTKNTSVLPLFNFSLLALIQAITNSRHLFSHNSLDKRWQQESVLGVIHILETPNSQMGILLYSFSIVVYSFRCLKICDTDWKCEGDCRQTAIAPNSCPPALPSGTYHKEGLKPHPILTRWSRRIPWLMV